MDTGHRETPRNTTGSGCPHGMPTPGSCIDCMDDGNLPPPPKPKRAGWPFTAEHPGPCTGPPCPGIEPGDRIVRMSDGGYRHVGACEKVRRG